MKLSNRMKIRISAKMGSREDVETADTEKTLGLTQNTNFRVTGFPSAQKYGENNLPVLSKFRGPVES